MAQAGTSHGAAPVLARAHHGSVSKEQRALIEDDLKAGRLPAVVATSSLELGIDMGAVDLVIQVESPPSVASGLQRVGRAGHQVGAVSRGVVFPKFRGDLVQTAVVVERMRVGRDRVAARAGQPASTCWPSRSSRCAPWTTGTSTSSSRWCAGRRRSPRCRARSSSRCSTCSPGATPATSSPSCAPASSGTASAARSPAGRVRSGWPSPAAAPSPTAGSTACSWPRARAPDGGSASSTRRWSTSPASATSSRWARRPGGSRTSPTTGCWSRPPPASPASCRSGTATRWVARPSWAVRWARSSASWSR